VLTSVNLDSLLTARITIRTKLRPEILLLCKLQADYEVKGKGKSRTLVTAPLSALARPTAEALRYMARTKQRRTYLLYTFPAVAGTHLPTPKVSK